MIQIITIMKTYIIILSILFSCLCSNNLLANENQAITDENKKIAYFITKFNENFPDIKFTSNGKKYYVVLKELNKISGLGIDLNTKINQFSIKELTNENAKKIVEFTNTSTKAIIWPLSEYKTQIDRFNINSEKATPQEVENGANTVVGNVATETELKQLDKRLNGFGGQLMNLWNCIYLLVLGLLTLVALLWWYVYKLGNLKKQIEEIENAQKPSIEEPKPTQNQVLNTYSKYELDSKLDKIEAKILKISAPTSQGSTTVYTNTKLDYNHSTGQKTFFAYPIANTNQIVTDEYKNNNSKFKITTSDNNTGEISLSSLHSAAISEELQNYVQILSIKGNINLNNIRILKSGTVSKTTDNNWIIVNKLEIEFY